MGGGGAGFHEGMGKERDVAGGVHGAQSGYVKLMWRRISSRSVG
jgi:hypothetical protein